MRPLTRIGRAEPVEQAVGTCGELSEYGPMCAEPAGHSGLHVSTPDASGCVLGWADHDRLRVVL